jgi:hydrogenase maturation protease
VRRILGIGSPFGADQAGWRAVDLLSEAGDLSDCELIKLDRPGSELLRYLEDVEDLVLIDAVLADGAWGTVVRLERDALSLAACRTSSHGFGVAEALQLADRLELLPLRLSLIGIRVGPDLEAVPEISRDQLLRLL